jgi:hypothetical protein
MSSQGCSTQPLSRSTVSRRSVPNGMESITCDDGCRVKSFRQG